MNTKLSLRDSLNIAVTDTSSEIENFQNVSLRPVLKLQNDLYLAVFTHYAIKQKVELTALTKEQRRIFIGQSLQKDVALKNMMLGITVGLLTHDELEFYLTESKECNRRIMTMLVERMTGQML